MSRCRKNTRQGGKRVKSDPVELSGWGNIVVVALAATAWSWQPASAQSIRIGTSAQFHELRPVAEIYTASRVPWLQTLNGCMEFSGMPARQV